MRVIAGTARGTVLSAPEGMVTRPTSDRLKENLFNILGPNLRGAAFADLFGGSGQMGIEALSRGAASAVFVDENGPACETVKKNLVKTNFSHISVIFTMPVAGAIRRFHEEGRMFDIIFMDPPYAGREVSETAALISETGVLLPEGKLIAELPAGNLLPDFPGLKVNSVRKYGDKQFVFWEHNEG